jgi:hypothetical protein
MSSYGIFTEKFHLAPDLACLYTYVSYLKNILINLQNQEAIAPLFGPKPNDQEGSKFCTCWLMWLQWTFEQIDVTPVPPEKRINICRCVKSTRLFNAAIWHLVQFTVDLQQLIGIAIHFLNLFYANLRD